MITIVTGHILESKAQVLVNEVTCSGDIEKGTGEAFKILFPEVAEDYFQRCEKNKVILGEPYLFKRMLFPWVLNFPVKRNLKSSPQDQDIINGIDYFIEKYQDWGVFFIAFPLLGWSKIKNKKIYSIIYEKLSSIEAVVEIWVPTKKCISLLKGDD